MIVRILGGGQFEVGDEHVETLEALDHKLSLAIEGKDEGGFEGALAELVDKVREVGKELNVETIVPSDLTLPHEGSTLAEVRDLLASEDMSGD